MQIDTLYKYHRENGGVTISPVQPDVEYTTMFRLIADEGNALTLDGEKTTCCVDTEFTDGWYEVAMAEDATEEE